MNSKIFNILFLNLGNVQKTGSVPAFRCKNKQGLSPGKRGLSPEKEGRLELTHPELI